MTRTPQDIPSFKPDLRTLINDIREGAHETYEYEMENMDSAVENYYRDNLQLFESKMLELEVELESYIDGSYTSFDNALQRLEEISNVLSQVEGNDGLTTVLVTLGSDSWDSNAAAAVRITVEQIKEIAVLQGIYVAELGRAVSCLRRILTHARADVFDLAEQAKKRLVGSSGFGLDLGDVLWIAAAIAAGVATSGAAGWAAWAIGNASAAWNQLEGWDEEGAKQERKIVGHDHFEILESALDELYKVRDGISGQEADLTEALRKDVAEVIKLGIVRSHADAGFWDRQVMGGHL
jgi:hypothetical protein